MKIHELSPFEHELKTRKRCGRGAGSGLGKTSGKGHKGQKARAGSGPSLGFEGGQMPLIRRLPKRGFYNRFRKENTIFNLEDLDKMFPDQESIKISDLQSKSSKKCPIKVLARGEVRRPMTIEAHAFSASAVQKIEQAGGQALKVKE
jgi:large subunit ribosomal protein L15